MHSVDKKKKNCLSHSLLARSLIGTYFLEDNFAMFILRIKIYIPFALAILFHPGKSVPRYICIQVLTPTLLLEEEKNPENEMSIHKNFL